MRKSTLLAIGSWALALFVLFLAWAPPHSAILPGAQVILWVGGGLVLLWCAGVLRSWFPRSGPGLSFRSQVGAVAPLLTTTLGVILAARGILPGPWVLILFSVATAAPLAWWGLRDTAAAGGVITELGVLGLGLPPAFILAPVAAFAFVGSVVWAIAVPDFGRMIARAQAVEVLVPYRVTADPAVTLEASAAAVVALTDTVVNERLGEGPFFGWSGDSVVARAAAGLDAEQRAWLRGLSNDPAESHMRTIARAAAIDPVAYIQTPIPAGTNAFSLPIPPVLRVRDVARRQLYRAALAHAENRPAVADSLVREVISYGLRLRDDADMLLLAAIGSSVAREGGLALAALWRARGRTAEADQLVAALAPVQPAPDTAGARGRDYNPRAELMARVRDSSGLRALRWEAMGVLGISRCTSANEALFGPAPELAALYDEVRPALVRTPKEGEVFDVFRRGLQGDPGDISGAAFAPLRWAFGDGTLSGCLTMATAMS
jgi:hypothetical protein